MQVRSVLVLMLTVTAVAQGVPEAAEPNDTAATATVLPLASQAYGEISLGDEDWYKITLANDSDFNIWTGPGFGGQIGDTRVRIFEGDGVTMLVDVDDGNTATHGYYTTLQGSLVAGDYFVAVRGFNATYAGTYTLDVAIVPRGTYVPASGALVTVNEGAEDNDPRLTSGVATVSQIDSSNVGEVAVGAGGTTYTSTTGDYDFYAINVTTPGDLRLETVIGAAAPVCGDTVIHLADAALARLAFDDEGGVGSLSLLTYTITTPGTYYAVVSGWGSSTGNYILEVTMPAPLPTGAASLTVYPGGCAGSFGQPVLGVRESSTHTGVFPERAILGSQFWADATSLAPSSALIRVIGVQLQNPPFNLAQFGFPSCNVEVSPLGLPFAISDANGDYFWPTTVPYGLSLINLPLRMQVLALDPNPPIGIAVSNVLEARCGISH